MNAFHAAAAFAVLVLTASPAAAQHGPQAQAAPHLAPASAEARRADIAVFRERFIGQDRALALAGHAQEAEQRLAALEANAGAVSQAYFELELARIVALADNGHSAAFPFLRAAHFNRIPLRFAVFGEDFYVVRAAPEYADLLGARLVSIDGHSAAEIRVQARALMGGVDGWRDRHANYLIESPEQLSALGLAVNSGQASYRFALPTGAEADHQIAAAASADAAGFATGMNRYLFPAPMETQPGWHTALDPASAPWSLQDPEQRFRWRLAPEVDGMVIEIRQNSNAANAPIADALSQFEAAIAEHRPRNLVLDMRWNSGGDLNSTRNFAAGLPGRVPGRVFVLTSPWTFSAAISTVGYLKQAAPDRVAIVGESVGDRLNFFAEGDIITLPNSRVMILNATERHDYATGCEGFSDCHGNVRRRPIRVPSLDPEIAAPWTIEAYLAGRDPAMEAIAAALR